MMNENNPYSAYTDNPILTSGPLGLVVALYEGAIQSSVAARQCLAERDIPGRTKSINKFINILTELMLRLDDEKGGEISKNLRGLYVYIQGRVLEAHLQQTPVPLIEAEKLLTTMLDGWKRANTTFNSDALPSATTSSAAVQSTSSQSAYGDVENTTSAYGFYVPESAEYSPSSAYAF